MTDGDGGGDVGAQDYGTVAMAVSISDVHAMGESMQQHESCQIIPIQLHTGAGYSCPHLVNYMVCTNEFFVKDEVFSPA